MNVRIIFLLIILLNACAPSNGPHKPLAAKVKTEGADVNGYAEIRPIFAKNCAACHPSRSGPDWLEYGQAKSYADSGKLKQRVVTTQSMPPPGSSQAAGMTAAERAAIGAWADAGAPEKGRKKTQTDPSAPTAPATQASGFIQQCFSCHGAGGPGHQAQPRLPRLAGQNENYLYLQLNAFLWRKRIDPSHTMNEIASGLTDEQMHEAARYFAGLKGLASEPAPTPLRPERVNEAEAGRQLAKLYCVSCHLNPDYKSGTSHSSIPKLAGQSESYLMNQLIYYRNNERTNNLMNRYAASLSDRDITALALYFSTIENPKAASQ